MKILVAEDNAGMRIMVGEILKTLGYSKVVAVENGALAWEKILAEPFDLLLTDWNMPVMNGLELATKVRGNLAFQALPILVFTAVKEVQQVREMVAVGVDGYLTKPFTPDQLREKLQTIEEKQGPVQVEQIFKGLERAHKEPEVNKLLVVFGEAISTAQDLSQPNNKQVRQFLAGAINALNRINASDPDIDLGYRLSSKSDEIMKLVRHHPDRVKILVLSPQMTGGVTIARLAGVNNQNFTVILACDSKMALAASVKIGLENFGVLIFARKELQQQSFEQIVREFVIAKTYTPDRDKLPDPGKIRRRMKADIENMVSLPVLPVVYRQIHELDRKPESRIQQWGAVIDKDPLSSAMIMRRAHSPLYGFTERVEETKKAVTLLGKNTVKELILCQAVKQAFKQVKEKRFSIKDFWQHSLAVAVTARILNFPLNPGQRTYVQEREFKNYQLSEDDLGVLEQLQTAKLLALNANEKPFISGLMHDIGRVAMVVSYPGIYPEIVETLEAQSWQIPMIQAEEQVTGGVIHTTVGQLLAQAWNLDKTLVQVTAQHHTPAIGDSLSLLISLADVIAGAVFPFPANALYPTVKIIRDGEEYDKAAAGFIAESVLKKLNIEGASLLEAGRMLAPTIKRVTEELSQQIG